MILSCVGSTALEDVTTAAPDALKWMQLFVFKSREMTKNIVQRAEKAGYKAIVLTVDSAVKGKRLNEVRNRSLLLPHVMNLPNVSTAQISDAKKSSNFEQNKQPSSTSFAFDRFTQSLVDGSISFEAVTWLKNITKLPIVLKGILTADDAREAIEHGADGIIVSNHGGRQLDYLPASVSVGN